MQTKSHPGPSDWTQCTDLSGIVRARQIRDSRKRRERQAQHQNKHRHKKHQTKRTRQRQKKARKKEKNRTRRCWKNQTVISSHFPPQTNKAPGSMHPSNLSEERERRKEERHPTSTTLLKGSRPSACMHTHERANTARPPPHTTNTHNTKKKHTWTFITSEHETPPRKDIREGVTDTRAQQTVTKNGLKVQKEGENYTAATHSTSSEMHEGGRLVHA
mmetsp:Transcript_51094/g.100406  ORF Transcript_51094/g.100406 Transcript_51094/m.100406 type:complete len:217 (-) Transcript_51094:287-937(-)